MSFGTRNIAKTFFIDQDGTTEAEAAHEFCSSYAWSLPVLPKNGLNGNPTVSLLVRNDESEAFKPYKDCTLDVPILPDGVCFIDSMLPYLEMKLEYKPGGATNGEIDAEMLLKPFA